MVIQEHFTKAFEEMLEHLIESKSEIATCFFAGRMPSQILDISFDHSDLHNNGKATMILTLDAGKVVYKPRSTRIDEWAYDFIKEFFADVVRLPKVISKDDYGFCEYIENKPITSTEEAGKYYARMGGLAAIFLLLSSRDCHFENIICDGKYPVIVDLESIVSPVVRIKEFEKSDIDNSLFFTGLMPQIIDGKQLSVLFNSEYDNISAPLIDGKKALVLSYQQEFIEGFENEYNRIVKNKNSIKKYLENSLGKDSKSVVRFILRSTSAYDRLITKISSLAWQKDANLKIEVFNTLNRVFEKNGKPEFEAIAACETEAILAGEIPYFYTHVNGKDLLNQKNIVVPNYFMTSAYEHILKVLDGFNEEEMEFEIQLLELAFKGYGEMTIMSPSGKELTFEFDVNEKYNMKFSY